MGQDDVLLGLVEAVDLVDEQDRAPAVHAQSLLRLGCNPAQLRHARADGADRAEVTAGEGRDEEGEGGLAAAGRAPEDDRRDLVGLDALAEHLARADDVLLPHELVEGPRPHPCGQGGLSS